MISNIINISVVVIASIVIIVCCVGIIIASRFQNKKNKKYKECLNIINEKKHSTFEIKDGLTKEEINAIDNEIDVDKLMSNLYNTYLELENKIKNLDTDMDNLLVEYLKGFYLNKINEMKEKGIADVTDGIELINYSIEEYSKEKLKFRITINCFSYKSANNKIVSGNNLKKVEQIILLSYERVEGRWLISSYEKIYEKKLSN